MNKSIILIAVIILMLLLGACGTDYQERRIKVKQEQVDAIISVNGELESAGSIKIGPPLTKNIWSYSITYMASEGKQVKPGDLLIKFDDKELKNKLENKKNEVISARKNLENTIMQDDQQEKDLKLKLEEFRMKLDKSKRKAVQSEHAVANAELEKLRIDLSMATDNLALGEERIRLHIENSQIRKQLYEKQIERLESEVTEINENIKKMGVRSEKRGILVYLSKYSGEKFAVGSRVYMSEKVLEVADLDNMIVKAQIPESDAGKVAVGQKVKIILDASPDTPFSGKIKSLGKIFRTKSYNQPAIVFDATVQIHQSDKNLMRPGMAARLDIVHASFNNAYEIPVRAILFDSDGSYVNVKSLLGQSLKRVALGAVGVEYAVVTEGLGDGDEVLVP